MHRRRTQPSKARRALRANSERKRRIVPGGIHFHRRERNHPPTRKPTTLNRARARRALRVNSERKRRITPGGIHSCRRERNRPPIRKSTTLNRARARRASRVNSERQRRIAPGGIHFRRGNKNRPPTRKATTKVVAFSCWWKRPGSNRRPLACEASALPAELRFRRLPDHYNSHPGKNQAEFSCTKNSARGEGGRGRRKIRSGRRGSSRA